MKQRLKTGLRAIGNIVRAAVDLRDMHVYGGIASACVGVAQVCPPGAWVLAGAALFWLGVRK